MTRREYIYRCPEKCPIGKKCFVIKVAEEIKKPIIVLQKCRARKGDIKVSIGGTRPP